MLLAAAAVLAGAVAQSATGFGFALVASPALFAVLDPGEAVTAIAALGFVLNVLVLVDGGPGLVSWRALAPLLLAAIPGLALGLLALEVLSKAAFQLGVGVAVVAAALLQVRRHATGAPAGTSLAVTGAAGLVSGALTTSLGVTGPPAVLWLEARGAGPRELRASLAAIFLVLNPAAVIAVVAARGAGDVVEPGRLLPLLAVLLAGYAGGAFAFRRLGRESFRIAVLVLVVAAGIASAVAGFAGL